MKTPKNLMALILCSVLLLSTSLAWAKVSKEEADRLKTDLTPLGGERAGNADGTIPAWEGGLPKPPPGCTTEKGVPLMNPYPDDKVLFSITAANMGQYEAKLSEGTKWLLRQYPDTFRLDVYPTRRPAAVPQWVADNTYNNALNAVSTEDRLGFLNAHGGIPFPIPENAEQVVFNGSCVWAGTSRVSYYNTYTINKNGNISIFTGGRTIENSPYYFQEKPAPGESVDIWNVLIDMNAPPRIKGRMIVIKDSSNPQKIPRRAWQYTPGQRRVRMAPTLSYDTPNGTSNVSVYDDMWMFSGALDRFDWKIIGKKEMYLPYNSYQPLQTPIEKFSMGGHFNPDMVRWELHRMWVVEATLKEGQRHVYGRRVFYYDEDTWMLAMKDQYDNRGEFWRFTLASLYQDYTLPGGSSVPWMSFDVTQPIWMIEGFYYGQPQFVILNELEKQPTDMFTPEYLRKIGRR